MMSKNSKSLMEEINFSTSQSPFSPAAFTILPRSTRSNSLRYETFTHRENKTNCLYFNRLNFSPEDVNFSSSASRFLDPGRAILHHPAPETHPSTSPAKPSNLPLELRVPTRQLSSEEQDRVLHTFLPTTTPAITNPFLSHGL